MTRRIDRLLAHAGLPPLERSAWVEVSVDTLIENATALADLASPAALGAVVKADGYGHGLEMAARSAVAGGATWLCVADAAEAGRVRRDGYEGRVFVLYPVPARMVATMARLGVDVCVGAVEEAKTIGSHLPEGTPTLAVQLEIDTGMTRGGVAPDEALTAATALAKGNETLLAGVWTHLASPEDPRSTTEQIDRFESVLTRLAAAGLDPGIVHAAASGGLLATDTTRHSLVRPGLAYYGVHPKAGGPLPNPVSPALAVRAHPVRITDVPPGTRVGYSGTWTAERPSRIATLPIGYADGWSRSSSPGTAVLVEGQRAPVVGRVSSDSLTVDITDVEDPEPNAEFILLGTDGDDQITADEVAEVRGTISWEVLQQLGSRLTRVYLSHSTPIALRAETSSIITTATGATIPSY